MQGQLTSQQYQSVLKYMQATSQQNFQQATKILQQYHFNLNTAINAKFNSTQTNNMGHNNNQGNRGRGLLRQQQQNDGEVLRKYIDFIKKENESGDIISNTYNFIKNFTIGLTKFITQILLPQSLLRKLIRSSFYVLYKDQLQLMDINDDKLIRLLINTKQKTNKSVFIVISPQQTKQQVLIKLLNKNDIINKIKDNYLFIGFTKNDTQLQLINNQRNNNNNQRNNNNQMNNNNQQKPQIIICRYNIYKQVIILKRYTGQQQINTINTQQLTRIHQQSKNHHKRDKNVLVKYRNFIRRQYYGHMYIQQQQQQQINFINRQQDTHHIRQQNDQYHKVAQQQTKRLQQLRLQQQLKLKQLQMLQQKQQQRKIRKLSIPDQPIDGQDIIRFSFRCPDGSNINRNFNSNQKVQIIYHWVQTNQEIQLEDNKKRQFQILYSYPPTPLSNKKDMLLKQVFQSDQQKLLIRQL